MLFLILSEAPLDEKSKVKFEEIYYKYRDMLFKVALKKVILKADAEDVLQEAFIKIAKNIKHIKNIDGKETASFLTIIVRNTAYDFLRKKSKHIEVNLDEFTELASTDGEINNMLDSIKYEKIVDIVKNIPSPYCEVLYLHYVRDLSVKQTAKLLERKPETVKMQIVRGKRILSEKLSEVLYE